MTHTTPAADPLARRLSGKVACITGVGTGVGRSCAILFAQAGAKVVASDIDTVALEETRALAAEQQLEIEITQVDATNPSAVTAWIDGAVQRFGAVDVLFNNAAHAHFAPFGEMTIDQWQATLRLELDIVFVPTRAVWPHMVARAQGCIINIASVSGMQATEPAGAAAHAAGKGGVISLTRQLALEGAPHTIRANSISPGPIITPMTEALLDHAGDEMKRIVSGWPMLGRTGTPLDVAYAGLFLASEEASWITGVNLPVDGGWSAKGGFTSH